MIFEITEEEAKRLSSALRVKIAKTENNLKRSKRNNDDDRQKCDLRNLRLYQQLRERVESSIKEPPKIKIQVVVDGGNVTNVRCSVAADCDIHDYDNLVEREGSSRKKAEEVEAQDAAGLIEVY